MSRIKSVVSKGFFENYFSIIEKNKKNYDHWEMQNNFNEVQNQLFSYHANNMN